MRLARAMEIIENGIGNGFRVSFGWKHGSMLQLDHFPACGEEPLKTEEYAWALAQMFARQTSGVCLNVCVVDAETLRPVPGYEAHKIENRG